MKPRFLVPGLILSTVRMEVSAGRAIKPCLRCGEVLSKTRHLLVKTGSGRSARSGRYCAECGRYILASLTDLMERAIFYMQGAKSVSCIRTRHLFPEMAPAKKGSK